MIRILIVDDHDVARRELAARLTREGLHVVAHLAAVDEATRAAALLQPDVILADLKRRDGRGIDLLRHLRLCAPDAALIALTSFFDGRERDALLKFGGSAYLLKDVNAHPLVAEIRKQRAAPKRTPAAWVQL